MSAGAIFLLSLTPIVITVVILVSLFEKKIKKQEMEDDIFFQNLSKQN
jgi:uncharacterized BrkB/YihY/UPF0761 family membrane protein